MKSWRFVSLDLPATQHFCPSHASCPVLPPFRSSFDPPFVPKLTAEGGVLVQQQPSAPAAAEKTHPGLGKRLELEGPLDALARCRERPPTASVCQEGRERCTQRLAVGAVGEPGLQLLLLLLCRHGSREDAAAGWALSKQQQAAALCHSPSWHGSVGEVLWPGLVWGRIFVARRGEGLLVQ